MHVSMYAMQAVFEQASASFNVFLSWVAFDMKTASPLSADKSQPPCPRSAQPPAGGSQPPWEVHERRWFSLSAALVDFPQFARRNIGAAFHMLTRGA